MFTATTLGAGLGWAVWELLPCQACNERGYQTLRLGQFPHVSSRMRLSTGTPAIHLGTVKSCLCSDIAVVCKSGREEAAAGDLGGIMQVFLTCNARLQAPAGLEIWRGSHL